MNPSRVIQSIGYSRGSGVKTTRGSINRAA